MATCPNCGNGLVDRAKFCPECGRAVAARPSTQEFRIITVVFCDVVKSTELERELDPQPMQRLLDRYGIAVRAALGGGASVGKRHGDGFMAAFGVAELYEDDALRAVRAADELRAALGELAEEVRSQRGLEFHVRLDINTGNVLVRDAGTLDEELTGTSVNLGAVAAGPGGAPQPGGARGGRAEWGGQPGRHRIPSAGPGRRPSGDLEEARRFVAAAITNGESSLLPAAVDCISRAMVEMLAGDLAGAEQTLQAGYRQLEEMGGRGPQVNVGTMLAKVRLLRGRLDEADELTRTCERLASPHQADAQVRWRSIRAIAVARRGELREAVQRAGRTDQLDTRAEAHADLVEVLLLAGRGREAAAELERAIPLFHEKGNEVGERHARRLLPAPRP
jgi:MalT-like TPR region/Adenylate and Guanylate cyclase catalytic domain/zinc-ribbon domain